jgi:hypothetical protein
VDDSISTPIWLGEVQKSQNVKDFFSRSRIADRFAKLPRAQSQQKPRADHTPPVTKPEELRVKDWEELI